MWQEHLLSKQMKQGTWPLPTCARYEGKQKSSICEHFLAFAYIAAGYRVLSDKIKYPTDVAGIAFFFPTACLWDKLKAIRETSAVEANSTTYTIHSIHEPIHSLLIPGVLQPKFTFALVFSVSYYLHILCMELGQDKNTLQQGLEQSESVTQISSPQPWFQDNLKRNARPLLVSDQTLVLMVNARYWCCVCKQAAQIAVHGQDRSPTTYDLWSCCEAA